MGLQKTIPKCAWLDQRECMEHQPSDNTFRHPGCRGVERKRECQPRCRCHTVGAPEVETAEEVVDVWDHVWTAWTWEACYNERATLTRIEPFTDTEPRLAENTHGQEQGNCGRFWCAYNFKVVGWISTGKYLKGMYIIGLTCGVDTALIQDIQGFVNKA